MSNITHEVSQMKRIIRRYELTDAEWERLQPYFPERQMGDKGRPRREPREMLNGIFWIARSGAAWRDLPERYGPWQTVYKRFKEWSESGLIEKIFHELGEDADLQDISIDSTYIKAHKASAGAERGALKTRRCRRNPQPKAGCCLGENPGQSVHRSEPRRQKHQGSRRCGRLGQSHSNHADHWQYP